MADNDSKLDEVLEGYKPISMKRLFYPRGMKLSEDFINAFHREYDRLVGEGINPKTLIERVSKAMKFHANDPRKYKQLDENDTKETPDPLGSGVEVHDNKQVKKLMKKKPVRKHKPRRPGLGGKGDVEVDDFGKDLEK